VGGDHGVEGSNKLGEEGKQNGSAQRGQKWAVFMRGQHSKGKRGWAYSDVAGRETVTVKIPDLLELLGETNEFPGANPLGGFFFFKGGGSQGGTLERGAVQVSSNRSQVLREQLPTYY